MKKIQYRTITRLSHRQRWIVYSIKDIYSTLRQLITIFGYISCGYERRLISTFWCILENILYIDPVIDGHTICRLWKDFANHMNTIVNYSINNTIYFQSNPMRKESIINTIKYYLTPGSERGIIISQIYLYKNYIMNDYKKRQIEIFYKYSILRRGNMTLDGLI